MNTASLKGKVILAGAGPGDPDLVTVKAANYLMQADTVLTDRLVSRVLLERYVKPGAQVIEVGKQCRRGVSTPQQTINELLVQHALEGKLVVRLKGGDVSFFSNLLDELQVLKNHAIPYEIVPGVTAASGAAAYTGMPLTAREHATAVRFLTYYKSTLLSDAYWSELAATDDTLVFYMSSETITGLVDQLVLKGIAADKKIAVIEQATTAYQQVYSCGIYEYHARFSQQTYLSPSLIIIGRVVALHQQYGWFEGNSSQQYYFKPITSALKTMTQDASIQEYAGRA